MSKTVLPKTYELRLVVAIGVRAKSKAEAQKIALARWRELDATLPNRDGYPVFVVSRPPTAQKRVPLVRPGR